MDYELIWWVAMLIIVILGLLAFYIASRIADYKEYKQKHEFTEYHDDMEDWGY